MSPIESAMAPAAIRRVISPVGGWLLAAALCLSAGCQQVHPWEKATLARDTLRPGGPLPEIGKIDQHVYTSKEAVKGGTGIGGGGCGCN